MMKHIRPLNFKGDLFVEGGSLISKKESIPVIRIDNEWFEINQSKMQNILFYFLGEEIGKKIKRRLRRAIILVMQIPIRKLRSIKIHPNFILRTIKKHNYSHKAKTFKRSEPNSGNIWDRNNCNFCFWFSCLLKHTTF